MCHIIASASALAQAMAITWNTFRLPTGGVYKSWNCKIY